MAMLTDYRKYKPYKITKQKSKSHHLLSVMATSVNDEIREMMVPPVNGTINLRKQLPGKWTRYIINLDTEGTHVSSKGLMAVGFSMLDLDTGQLLVKHDIFVAVKPPYDWDESTKQFWDTLPELLAFYEKQGKDMPAALEEIAAKLKTLKQEVIKDDSWMMVSDNPAYDFCKLDDALTKNNQDPARRLLDGRFGKVRDQQSLVWMFFAAHKEGPADAYYKLKQMATEVHATLLAENPDKYGMHDPEHDKWLVAHHPVTDARIGALMLLAMFRFMVKYPDSYLQRMAEFVI
jgi:hypothetical protein